ncbi:MAG TPA: hypothetical protein VFA59_24650 [Vicinamibacterales bacterium]|nr:hypothetical protein [Vicinamibacterales bacterium]
MAADGAATARRWYRRQVLGFVSRCSWPWGLAATLVVVGRYFLDDFVLPHIFDPQRAEIMTRLAIDIFFFAGAVTAWRTQRIASAPVVALAATLVVAIASWIYVAIVMIAPVPAWSTPADLGEALFIPILLAGLALAASIVGALVGRLLQFADRRSAALFGIAFGGVLGVANLIDTYRDPLSDDNALVMLTMLAATLAVVSFVASRRYVDGRMRDAIIAGVVIAVSTAVMASLLNLVRVNVFLHDIQNRDDWRNLLARYRASGYPTLRAYANHEYVSGLLSPTSFVVTAVIGGMTGAIGGVLRKLTHREPLQPR